MKYGIAVRIVEMGYVEIEAECEAEAKVALCQPLRASLR